jgi:hypothetical protein
MGYCPYCPVEIGKQADGILRFVFIDGGSALETDHKHEKRGVADQQEDESQNAGMKGFLSMFGGPV